MNRIKFNVFFLILNILSILLNSYFLIFKENTEIGLINIIFNLVIATIISIFYIIALIIKIIEKNEIRLTRKNEIRKINQLAIDQIRKQEILKKKLIYLGKLK
jgi:hypothetical protein